MIAATTWPDVTLALIAALPGLIAAIAALRIHSKIRTPSGKSIGAQVEDVLHTALSNNYRLRSITQTAEPPTPEALAAEELRQNVERGES